MTNWQGRHEGMQCYFLWPALVEGFLHLQGWEFIAFKDGAQMENCTSHSNKSDSLHNIYHHFMGKDPIDVAALTCKEKMSNTHFCTISPKPLPPIC